VSITITTLSGAVAAAGALGTASFGIVEGLKWTALGTAGFGCIGEYLGHDLVGCLRVAYGPDFERLLRAQYRQDSHSQSVIAKSLRQGVRIGLTAANAENVARFLGTVAPAALRQAAAAVEAASYPDPNGFFARSVVAPASAEEMEQVYERGSLRSTADC